MGKRKNETVEYWEKELQYIERVDPVTNSCFNYSQIVFNRYIIMQSVFAAKDGFNEISNQMLKVIKNA